MNIMESDPIISLRGAIVDLTTAIRSMRFTTDTDAICANSNHDNQSIVALESAESSIATISEPVLEHQGSEPIATAVASLAELNEEAGKAQQELDQIILALDTKETELATARNSLITYQQEVKELGERKSQLAKSIEEMERTNEQLQLAKEECAKLEARLKVLQSEESVIEAKSRQIASREDALRTGFEEVKQTEELMRKLWPFWLCAEDLKQWKEQIERDVFLDNALPSFCLLFAAIHNYNASLRDPDNRIFLDALRDLGRRLYQWLKDLGKSEESTAEIVEAWAVAINTECGDRCSIQVAVPGNPANNKWMSFTPRGGSAPDVTIVRSWCVSDNQGRPIHRAEVAV
jgi:hypothetical protein